ncbi:MAG TPA: ribonuclease H-like domain-containing protein [Bacillota bacterium]|jgi:uncharacterized protein YprB with RNaseH-like and TPR domain|nr:ribonuclease H-like domain-containing protein [Bacillota bacterium]HQE08954.1 ribonuclease H-like domain-containing protein [Bacillota bacterium]
MKNDLRSRLERLQRSGELGRARPATESAGRDLPGEVFLFPGEESLARTSSGCCYLRDLSFPLQWRHGAYTLEESLDCSGSDLALPARDRSLPPIEPARFLFLDVETTGLAGGTGTWVFLIGLGWLEGDSFRIRQYFLRNLAEEEAMLRHFAAFAAPFSGLISFNGKAFDLPLIQTRQLLRRTPQFTAPRAHLDLLICARSLWKERFPSRSLGFLEGSLLGFQRHGDIPGEEIPAVYFNYLRRGETALLKKVFEHNVYDILSMAVLLGRVASTTASEKPEHPSECFSLGRLYYEAGDMEKAQRYFRQLVGSKAGSLEEEALAQLGLLCKKRGNWVEAIAWWRELARRGGRLDAYVELAKYYEHRARDYLTALDWSNRALAEACNRRFIPFSSPCHPAALRHRINRLNMKIKRQKLSPGLKTAE